MNRPGDDRWPRRRGEGSPPRVFESGCHHRLNLATVEGGPMECGLNGAGRPMQRRLFFRRAGAPKLRFEMRTAVASQFEKSAGDRQSATPVKSAGPHATGIGPGGRHAPCAGVTPPSATEARQRAFIPSRSAPKTTRHKTTHPLRRFSELRWFAARRRWPVD